MPSLLNILTLMVLCMAVQGGEGLPRNKESRPGNRYEKARKAQAAGDVGPHGHTELVQLMLEPSALMASHPIPQLANHSLSPWMYSTTHDESRFPVDIAQAKCLLTGCRNSLGEEVMDVESRPIFQQILVLRRLEGDGKSYVYKLESKTITVGCTCVRPNTVQQM